MNHVDPLVEPAWPDAHRVAFDVPTPVSAEQVSLSDATGRVLAEPMRSLIDLPGSTTSAMDGWVVGSAAGPWRLVASSLAGHPMTERLDPGTAAVIATGGVIPDGAYGVLRREFGAVGEESGAQWVNTDGGDHGEPARDGHVRPAGQEARYDDVLVPVGAQLTPPQVGLAAMAGHDVLSVRRAVTGDLLIMGDEVLRSGLPASGQVRDAFAPQLPQFARSLGLDVGAASFVPDTLDAAVAAIHDSAADVIITTGGTAGGPADFLHRALQSIGAELIVDMIAMRPGHPVLLAALGNNRFLVGLPGNPLSAMAGMLTLTRPLVRALRGQPQPDLGEVATASAVVAPAHDSRLVPYRRVTTPDGERAMATDWLGSGMLRGLASAEGVMVVPPGGVPAGAAVVDIPLPW